MIPAKLHRLVRVRALIEVALPHLHTLPPAQRADVYEGISDVTRDIDETLCVTAATIATHLREAELLQLNFRSLLAVPETPIQSV